MESTILHVKYSASPSRKLYRRALDSTSRVSRKSEPKTLSGNIKIEVTKSTEDIQRFLPKQFDVVKELAEKITSAAHSPPSII